MKIAEVEFYPQPGDLILLQRPAKYADGTFGPLIRIYRDNFFFGVQNHYMTEPPAKHTFRRGERILRLFKLYQNWEFLPPKSHKLFLFYPDLNCSPGMESEEQDCWHLVRQIRNRDKHGKFNPQFPIITQFSHVPPSKLFSPLSKEFFAPRLQDIIIRTIPKPETRTSNEKCANCKKQEEDALYWRHDVNDPFSLPPNRAFDPTTEGCDYCRVPRNSSKLSTELPVFTNRWELEYWSEKFQPQVGDLLVRYDIDTHYGGQFKKTHVQVELFAYTAPTKSWTYMGMDFADFGPLIHIHDVIYKPQPGDIIISKSQKWSVSWVPHRHSGGLAMLYKDMEYFGASEGGQNLWLPESPPGSKGLKKKRSDEAPNDSWIVRLGSFDEYWDFHFNDRAEVFAMHPVGQTMLLHHSTDYQHMGQEPLYKYGLRDYDPPLMGEVEIEPNHWDIVIRRIEKVHEDPLKTRDWKPDPHHWMRDPTLWGRDVPPRFDKEVELQTYWSGFVFEADDFLLRAGYGRMDEDEIPEFDTNFSYSKSPASENKYGPPNPAIPALHTNASVELYQVKIDEENTPKFIFLGRDQYSFPDEYVQDVKIEYVKDEATQMKQRTEPKDDSKNGETSKVQKTKEGSKQGDGKPQVIIVKTKEGDRYAEAAKKMEANELKFEASKTLKLSAGNEVALE